MNAIVTGATKGIGRALVMHLAANNYNVALCARNEEQVQKFIGELCKMYPTLGFYGMAADFENIEDVASFAGFASTNLGNIDVLINNAGLYLPSDLMNEEKNALLRQMNVNVYAPHYLSKFFGKKMKAQGKGHIFNICSIASVKPVGSAASYSISKTALLSLTKILREELTNTGVSVTAILPGSTLTDSWAGTSLSADRFVAADDVAKAVISCLSMSPGANVDEIIIRPLKGDI
jgi:3-oxoacyl-[acyl-carrier protein] reductase